jgi:coproporphyrinogen III oxidase
MTRRCLCWNADVTVAVTDTHTHTHTHTDTATVTGWCTQDVGAGMLQSWLPYVEAKRGASYSDAQREWQLIRRGRYLEFNLLYDRGVK